MTRTLPWVSRTSISTQLENPASSTAPRAKRQRLTEPGSDDEDVEIRKPSRRSRPKMRGHRTSDSPLRLLEPPPESFMKEGMENDDGFRMVEDEFLDAAKQFTKYLHAAEYQKMKMAARSQNAETVGTISRPVTMRMPGETKRKVENVARSKAQVSIVKRLLKKHSKGSESEDEFDEAQDPWVGTPLHGLMDSPRKSAPSLMKVGGINADTRAAAGFPRPHTSRSLQSSPSNSQTLANRPAPQPNRVLISVGEGATSSDEDEDLDAPTRKPKFSAPSRTCQSFTTISMSPKIRKTLLTSQSSRMVPNAAPEPGFGVLPSKTTLKSAETIENLAALESKARVARKLEQARAQKVKAEREARKKRLHDIPTFL